MSNIEILSIYQTRINYKFSQNKSKDKVTNLVYAQNLDNSTIVTYFNHN
jgi:hypothetical protein